MPYNIVAKRPKKARTVINVHQNKFDKAYVSAYPNSRRPIDSLADMTNMEIDLDFSPRPRPPLVRYGTQPTLTIIGRGEYRWNGTRALLFMMDNGTNGQAYHQTDGGAFTLIGGTYSRTAYWAGFCQSSGRVYIYNGTDSLSYIDLATMTIKTYTALTTPSAPTGTKSGMASANTFTQYYAVSANNDVGESAASLVATVAGVKVRDAWISGTDFIDLSWPAVTGATSYTVYTGDKSTALYELFTVTNTSYRDDGSAALNTFKTAPVGNSTQGAIFNFMYNDPKNSQVYGVDNNNNLYYSAPGTGDFSPYNGGGFIGIDTNGDSSLNYVTGFRTGKGDPVITVSSRGAAGKGLLNHVTFNTLTVGAESIVYPEVLPANGLAGTYAPRCTIRAGDAITYPTGLDIQSTGTSQNIINILTTISVAQVIRENDVTKLNLQNLYKAAGVEHLGRLYMCLPVNSTDNNEIWYMDTTRHNLWVLRWPVAAKDIWEYEDNSGYTHLCILRSDNLILEFTRAGTTPTTDDGVVFNTRCAFSSLVWDVDGITMANIRKQYAKLLSPAGKITLNSYGLSRKGVTANIGTDTYLTETSFTGIGQWDYSGNYQYGDDPGQINSYAKSLAVLQVKPKGLLNQLDWELVTQDANCDYYLSSVNTRGIGHPDLIYNG
jgi:hypothetical protein